MCPSNGNTQALISPLVNKEVMKQHLKLISEATEPGRHAVVVMDGAGWHTIDTASPFTNVSLLKLPPYSPELNPMEQVWQWLRQRCLSNRVFRGYEEIVEQVSRAWNTFIADVERVKKSLLERVDKVGQLINAIGIISYRLKLVVTGRSRGRMIKT